MKTKEQIKARLKEVESDKRLGYKPATVFSNAPLALIQTALETEMELLKWILEDTHAKG